MPTWNETNWQLCIFGPGLAPPLLPRMDMLNDLYDAIFGLSLYVKLFPVSVFFFVLTIAVSIAAENDHGLRDRSLLDPWKVLRERQYYRLITSGLVHSGWLHLGLNMFSFYVFSFSFRPLESPLFLGHLHYAGVYLTSMLVSGYATSWIHRDDRSYRAVGASGAISGLAFSYLLLHPDDQFGLFFFIPIYAWQFGILYIIFSFWAAKRRLWNVAHDAHLAGALAGFAYTLIVYPHLWRALVFKIDLWISAKLYVLGHYFG